MLALTLSVSLGLVAPSFGLRGSCPFRVWVHASLSSAAHSLFLLVFFQLSQTISRYSCPCGLCWLAMWGFSFLVLEGVGAASSDLQCLHRASCSFLLAKGQLARLCGGFLPCCVWQLVLFVLPKATRLLPNESSLAVARSCLVACSFCSFLLHKSGACARRLT